LSDTFVVFDNFLLLRQQLRGGCDDIFDGNAEFLEIKLPNNVIGWVRNTTIERIF